MARSNQQRGKRPTGGTKPPVESAETTVETNLNTSDPTVSGEGPQEPSGDVQGDGGADDAPTTEKAAEKPSGVDSGDVKPDAKGEHNSADVHMTTDGNGNALDPVVPARPVGAGTTLLPFEYTDVDGDHIKANEDVQSVMTFMGTSRTGTALAYVKGTVLLKSVLDNVKKSD